MEFSEYYVAYFDVLGYKDAFKESKDISAKLIESIESSIDLMKKIVSIVNTPSKEKIEERAKIEYKIFSDNILICCKKTNNLISEYFLASFLRLVAFIQRVFFMDFHLIVRGGITKGPLYLTDDFVGGKALIDAVELEDSAVYPRIVVADCILNELISPKIQSDVLKNIINASCRDLLVKHSDDKVSLNYIISYDPWIMFPENNSQTEKIESLEEVFKIYREGRLCKPIYNPACRNEISVILRKHKSFVEEKVLEFSRSSNDVTKEPERMKILKKYLWLVSFHNKICDHALYQMPQLKIILKSDFNEQTLAFDVSVG